MKQKTRIYHLWLILAAYGVWFAMLSGAEEAARGKYWKVALSLLFGLVVWLVIENKTKE